MSLADDAKLLLIPTAYKSGKVYSVFPTNGDGDFDYTRSGDASRVNPGGFIETKGANIPRIDHTGGGCPSLLLEPERTNYATNNTSMDTYSNSVFGNNPNPTQTADYTIAPDGTLTATRLQTSKTGTNYSVISFPTTSNDGSGGGYYTASVYVKSNTGNNQSIAFYGANSAPNNRTATTEWSRIQFTGQRLGNTKYAYLGTFNGTDDDIDISVWGAQIELVNSYPSSLIYTEANIETRFADECENGGDADLFDFNECSIYLDLTPFVAGFNTDISLSAGTNDDRFTFFFRSNGTQLLFGVWAEGSNQLYRDETITYNTRNKLLLTAKENEFKIYINGTLKFTDTFGVLPTGINKFSFATPYNSNHFEGKVYDTRVYDRVLTEAEAIELTT